MNFAPIAILEHKKEPFLKAFIRTGKIAPATRSARISRDAVYDWLRIDPIFRKAFQKAKRQKYDHQTATLSEAIDILLAVVKPLAPAELYPRIVAAVNLMLSQRKFKDAPSPTARSTSRNKVRFPSVEVHAEPASSSDRGNRFEHGKNGPLT